MAYPFQDSRHSTTLTASVIRMRRAPVAGWTVLEILFVMAIIAILSGVTFGLATGVHRRAAMGRAKVDLAVLSTALEAYRLQYGDYPWIPATMPSGITTSEEFLFNALAGKLGPKAAPLNGRVLIETSRLSLKNEILPDPDDTSSVANAVVDPWGRDYRYYYKKQGNEDDWVSPSYRLYSGGIDGASDDPAADGTIDFGHEDNIDNIYAGRD